MSNNFEEVFQHVRNTLRLKHLNLRTEEAYLSTIKRFLLFHGRQHPASLGPAEVRAYLTHLAVEEHVAASTQNVARNALMFLFREVLGVENLPLDGITPAKRPRDSPSSSPARKSKASSPTSTAHHTSWPPCSTALASDSWTAPASESKT